MKCYKILEHLQDMTALDFDADINPENRRECFQVLVRKISIEITVIFAAIT